ncbi:PR domain zinc finger protein 5-like isoform X3 [Trichoplusia ni]|uniref:PR domain zinc finger protein 5-like isoform X3 n=1 Tax=Trichoplusia ni TaxID=7111 RepID=A0A7E5WT34_TRINI|nr:PR domain zinc finger protein 5-like isoform X3 [Trichoplusia ni]
MMEFDEIVVKETPGLCRCCLSEGCYKDLGSEYSWMNETEVYADMLLECFDISITQHNEGPNGPNRLICEVCITRLRDACNFKKQVLDSEKKFIDMMGRGEFRPKMLIYQTQMKAEDAVEAVADDAEVEYLEDDIDFGEEDLIKDETEPSVSDITVSTLPVKGKRGRPRKNALVKPEKRLKTKVDDKKKVVAKGLESEPTKNSANYLRRRNLQILFNNTTLIPFKWRGKYMCFFCGDDFDTYEVLKKHTKSHGLCSHKDRALKLVKASDSEIKIDVSDVTCEICSKTFSDLDKIVDHLILEHSLPYNRNVELMMSAYRLIDLQCLLCDTKFNYLRKLISHMNNFHPNNCFMCQDCDQKFNKKRDLDSHVRFHHRKEYACMKCQQTFPSNSALHTHRTNAHSSTCNICFKTFSSDSKRLVHMKRDHDDQTECGFCQRVLTTKQAFLRHAAICTENTKKDVIVIDDEEKKQSVKELRSSIACIFNMSTALPFKFFMNRFRCFYCPKDFTTSDDLKQHTLSEHPLCDISFKSMKLRNRYDGVQIKIDISNLSCKLCLEELTDLDDLIRHLTSEHKVNCDKSLESNIQCFKLIKDNFPCPICGEIFRYFGLLLNHISRAHTDNKYICMYCGKSFRTDPNLRAHVSRRHTNLGNYKCSDCDLVFPTNNALKIHLGAVHGSKIIQCSECLDKFTSQYWMQRHMITIHGTGHKCSYCGKLFIKNSFMVNHVRRCHLKEKNVECSVCFERFFDGQRLKMHMVKHIGERNFHCDVCGKKFLWKRNLRGHMSSHIRNSNAQVT